VALLATATFAFRDTFHRAEYARDARRYLKLSAFLRDLPPGTVLAGPPNELDDIVIQSGKPGISSYLLDHRWYGGHRDDLRERILATFEALYAADPGPIDELRSRYGATHLIVSRSLYGERLRRGAFGSRYDRDVRRRIGSNRTFYLAKPFPGTVVYRDESHFVLELPVHPGTGDLSVADRGRKDRASPP
jgi:hypothetical protein